MGELKTVDLKENGGDVNVTNANREEYVNLYVEYLIHTSVQPQFEAFHRGFKKVLLPLLCVDIHRHSKCDWTDGDLT